MRSRAPADSFGKQTTSASKIGHTLTFAANTGTVSDLYRSSAPKENLRYSKSHCVVLMFIADRAVSSGIAPSTVISSHVMIEIFSIFSCLFNDCNALKCHLALMLSVTLRQPKDKTAVFFPISDVAGWLFCGSGLVGLRKYEIAVSDQKFPRNFAIFRILL